jgi:hypothetical protein
MPAIWDAFFDPPCAQSKLEASFGEQIKRGHFFGQQSKVPVIDVEDQGSQTQRPAGLCRCHKRQDGRELVSQVIRHLQDGVAKILDLVALLDPFLPGGGSKQGDPKTKRMEGIHSIFLLSSNHPWVVPRLKLSSPFCA